MDIFTNALRDQFGGRLFSAQDVLKSVDPSSYPELVTYRLQQGRHSGRTMGHCLARTPGVEKRPVAGTGKHAALYRLVAPVL